MKNEKETIRVVYCEPGRIARITEIETGLEAMQRVVGGGYIEAYYHAEPGNYKLEEGQAHPCVH